MRSELDACGLCGAATSGEAEADVLDMRDDLFEQLCDVIVVEFIEDLTTLALADHQTEVPQEAKLV